jgi:hypothetical protein
MMRRETRDSVMMKRGRQMMKMARDVRTTGCDQEKTLPPRFWPSVS